MKKFSHLAILFISALMLALLSFPVCASGFLSDLRVEFSIGGVTQTIWAEENKICLPATIDIQKIPLVWSGEELTITCGKTKMALGTLRSGELLDITSARIQEENGTIRYPVTFSANGREKTISFYQDRHLPALFIDTTNGLSYLESSKNNRDKNASILLVDETGKIAYSDSLSQTKSEIKGRGNATFSYAKKAFQIKLSAKQSLLEMDAAKTWILLANYVDQSQLHNALAFTMGDLLNLPYNIQYRYIDLYIDGSYRGLYQLCEKVQIGSGRVDIRDLEKANEKENPHVSDFGKLPVRVVRSGELIENSILSSYTYIDGVTSPSDVSGGYLVELDNVWGASEPSRFTTENGNTYVIKSPEFASREEMEYIARLFADMEEAIYAENGKNRLGKHYSEYIDMDSFAGIYIIQELLKNWDAYQSSMFFFKDADTANGTAKIYMGPLWDMDNTLGNINFETYASDTAFLWAQNGKFSNYVRALSGPLMRQDDFASLVSQKYGFLYTKTKDYLASGGWIDQTVETIRDAVLMDRARWNIDDPNRWVLNSSKTRKVSTRFVHFDQYGTPQDETPTTALGYLRYYLSSRAEALFLALDATLPTEPEETTSAIIETTFEQTIEATTGHTEATQKESTSTHETTSENEEASKPDAITWPIIAVFFVLILVIAGFILTKKRS